MEQQQDPREEHEGHNQRKSGVSTGTKITVLVILILLLAAGILLPIKLVPNAVSNLGNTLSSIFIPNQKTTLSTQPTDIHSGNTFTLKWSGRHKTNGTYTISYDCQTGVHLETSINQPNEPIACGSTYYFSPNDNALDLTPFSETNHFTDINLTLGFLQNGSSNIDPLATTTIMITNENLAGTTTPPTPTSTPSVSPSPSVSPKPSPSVSPKPAQQRVSNPYGLADLQVRPIASGYINGNGVFVPSVTVGNNVQAAIRFQIINVGTNYTGSWTFAADLPSQTDPRYVSGPQQNLGPGDRIEYTLGFNNLTNTGNNTALITADPSNLIREASEINNSARMNIIAGQYSVTETGKADLTVRIIDTGSINRSTGTYTPSSAVSASDRAGIRFKVQNSGQAQTGSWRFSANLPTNDSGYMNYQSVLEPSLNPGQKFTFTLGFDNVRSAGTNVFSITADSDNRVSEINEGNNVASGNIYRY